MTQRLIGLLLIALALPPLAAAQNPYGVQVSISGRYPTEHVVKHYQEASDMIGEWGHIRVGAELYTPPERGVIPTLIACRAMKLIPILTEQSSPRVEGDDPFRPNEDGTYDREAQRLEVWARAVYDAGLTIPYYEVGNEPQGHIPAEVHARWCISVANALHRVDPNIKVSPAGMAGSGADYYREMLELVPELADHMGVYSCHPYAANRPPQYADDDLGIQGYRWTLDALRDSGIENPTVICTETGWEINTHADKRFPHITESLRAEYIVEAFTKYWAPDPAVIAVTPFMLQSIPWNGWETWDFIREDGTLTEQYKALAAVPKPQGRDHQPTGSAVLQGRLTESTLGAGIHRGLVWIVPQDGHGAYAAASERDGGFRIDGIPAGAYYLAAKKRTCAPMQRVPVTLHEGEVVTRDLTLQRVGMLRASFNVTDATGINSDSFHAFDLDPEVYAWDGEVGRERPGSLRIHATPGVEAGYWVATDYCAALPGERYALEVWVKTQDFVPGPDGGIEVRFAATNSFMLAYETSWAPGPLEGTHDWTLVNVTVHAPPKTRRHRVDVIVRGESGTVWFDDVYADKAEHPLPGALAFRQQEGEGVLRGRVESVDESVLHEATVFTTPGNYHAVTNRVGEYEFTGLPAGEYMISACHALWGTLHTRAVAIGDAPTTLHLELPYPDWPETLQNGDMEQDGMESGDMGGWKPYGIISGDGVVRNGWMSGHLTSDHPGFMARTGEGFLGYISSYNTKNGGTYQTVKAEPNALYELRAWIKTVQREGVRYDVANRIGIDPMGMDDPDSPYIIWTPFRPSPEEWSELDIQVRANRNRITVFLGHRMVSGIQWSVNMFDDVTLERIGDPIAGDDAGAIHGVGDAHLPFPLEQP